jgi:hypothetical protein
MKKEYIKPTMMVVEVQSSSILAGSPVRNVQGNTNVGNGGSDAGYSGPIRSRQASFCDWDEE